MCKKLTVLVLTLMMLATFTAGALATATTELQVYNFDDDSPLSQVNGNARVLASHPMDGGCNQLTPWVIPIKIYARVAPWMLWDISNTRWSWYVRKPGDYYVNATELSVQSNSAVQMVFQDFGDLVSGSNPTDITSYYSFKIGTPATAPTTNQWKTGANFTAPHLPLAQLRNTITGYLWNRIEVTGDHSKGLYKNENATITLTLQNSGVTWLNQDGSWNL